MIHGHQQGKRAPRTVLAAILAAACSGPGGAGSDAIAADPSRDRELLGLLQAADRRDDAGAATLIAGLSSEDPFVRRTAVRGLGRLERPELVGSLAPALDDPLPAVRGTAAWAVAQSVHAGAGTGVDAASSALGGALVGEPDPWVRSRLAHAIGRLPYATPEAVAAAERRLVDTGKPPPPDAEAPPETLLGVALGLEALSRNPLAPRPPGAGTLATLRDLGTRPGAMESDRRIRRLAVLALTRAGLRSPDPFDAMVSDGDAVVRASALRGATSALLDAGDSLAARARALGAQADPAPEVRLEALRLLERVRIGPAGGRTCQHLIPMFEDPEVDVALVALDSAALPCTDDRTSMAEALARIAAALPPSASGAWHRPAHAIVALAATDPGAVAEPLAHAAQHESPFVRRYAARAAARAGSRRHLEVLAQDPDPNVREAAALGLAAIEGRSADPTLIGLLDADDPQLLITVSRLLDGTGAVEFALPALLDAFERVSGARRATDRDARMALLERIADLAARAPDRLPATAPERLRSYRTDFDSRVAETVAGMVATWTGQPLEAAPEPRIPTEPGMPSPDRIRTLEAGRVHIDMERGGTIVIRLFAWEAPTNADRFARMVAEGTFDGLTFHRVVPGFVIQGGSPGANEYAGHGEYTRDELGGSHHWRGTVGTSTRGRDTGDGQIFVNLTDNVRLDGDYTAFGLVESGLPVVDGVLEGDRIRDARFVPVGGGS